LRNFLYFCFLFVWLINASKVLAEGPLNQEFLLRSFLVNAELARKQGNCKEAISFYRKYLAQIEKAPGVWNNLGVCLYEERRYSDAILAFKMAYLQKKDSVYLYNQALCFIALGQIQKACEILKKVKFVKSSFLNQLYHIKRLCQNVKHRDS